MTIRDENPVKWFLEPFPLNGNPYQVILFNYAGAGAAAYHPWLKVFRDRNISACALQLPGRESRLREPAFKDMIELVETVAEVCAKSFAGKKLRLFGHSMGAAVAYELAHLLAGRIEIEHLFVSGARSPDQPRDLLNIHELSDDEFVSQIVNRYKGLPQAVLDHPELLSLVTPVLRADFELLENYRFVPRTPKMNIPISAFGGSLDPIVSETQIKGWGELTAGGFEYRILHGAHFFLHQHIGEIVEAIGR